MTTPRRTIARRIQAVVVGLGVAGSLGTAAVIGLSTGTATDAGTSTGQTPPLPGRRAQPAVQPRGENDDEGGRARTAQVSRTVTPQPAPAASAGSTHATTSGS